MDVARSEFDASFFEKNPSFAATSHVIEITRPLSSLGLGYFTFDRHYIDGSRIALTNHAQWIRFYWEHGLFRKAIFEISPTQFANGHVFWEWLNREPIYSAAAEHGVDHGITLTKRHANYCDFFHFGATNNNIINSGTIINNIEKLHKFASIFIYKMKPIIRTAENDRIIACAVDRSCTATNMGKTDLDAFEKGLGNLLGKRDVSRTYLGEEFDHRYLTRAEVLLLEGLLTGASCLEISERLNISSGAVDKHVKNIKEKLCCKTLCQMGFIAGRLGVNAARNLSDW
jgi:DNA-binding CsgD family transcriptional regulator